MNTKKCHFKVTSSNESCTRYTCQHGYWFEISNDWLQYQKSKAKTLQSLKNQSRKECWNQRTEKEMIKDFIIDIKPCPFCGLPPTVSSYEDGEYGTKMAIHCSNRFCAIKPSVKGDRGAFWMKPETVIKKWNRRAKCDS